MSEEYKRAQGRIVNSQRLLNAAKIEELPEVKINQILANQIVVLEYLQKVEQKIDLLIPASER